MQLERSFEKTYFTKTLLHITTIFAMKILKRQNLKVKKHGVVKLSPNLSNLVKVFEVITSLAYLQTHTYIHTHTHTHTHTHAYTHAYTLPHPKISSDEFTVNKFMTNKITINLRHSLNIYDQRYLSNIK